MSFQDNNNLHFSSRAVIVRKCNGWQSSNDGRKLKTVSICFENCEEFEFNLKDFLCDHINMAFFGLTALGYQNSFAAASITALNIHVFTLKEYEDVWKNVLGDKKTCNADELQKILRTLFHGPIPPYDAHVFAESFNGCVDELTYDEYITTISQLREWAEHESEPRNHVSSNCDMKTSSDFQESIRRHKRLPRGLQDKQQIPLTAAQEVGLSAIYS